jgi:hypothetical protein
MQRGFDFFTTSQTNNKQEIEMLENQYSIVFPPLLKCFMNTFEFGEYRDMCIKNEENTCIAYPKFNFNWLSATGDMMTYLKMGCIFPLSTIVTSLGEDEAKNYGLIEIGCCTPDSVRIWIGIKPHNADEVWFTDWDKVIVREKVVKVADNIFEFVKMLYIEEIEDNSGRSETDRLYRNWNEDFWQVREEGDTIKLIEQKNHEVATLKAEKYQYYHRLKNLARAEKQAGKPLTEISERYGFSVEELSKVYF